MFLKPEDRRGRELANAILSTLRGIEEQLRFVTEALRPSRGYKDSASFNASSDEKQAQPKPMITVRAITELGDADARKRDAERNSSDSFQKASLSVQWWLFIATLLAFGAAAYYATIAKQQLATMDETLQEVHVQNFAQQRALLSVPSPPTFLEDGQLAIRVKNSGRLSAKVLRCHIAYVQKMSYGRSFLRYRDVRSDTAIPAEGFYDVGVWLPQIPRYLFMKGTSKPALGRGLWEVNISISVDYDGGFGDKETLSYCSFFDPVNRVWGNNCLSPTSLDISSASEGTHDMEIAPKK